MKVVNTGDQTLDILCEDGHRETAEVGVEIDLPKADAERVVRDMEFEYVDAGRSGPTVPELKERAKAAGIEGYSRMKKDELLTALAESEDPNDEVDGDPGEEINTDGEQSSDDKENE